MSRRTPGGALVEARKASRPFLVRTECRYLVWLWVKGLPIPSSETCSSQLRMHRTNRGVTDGESAAQFGVLPGPCAGHGGFQGVGQPLSFSPAWLAEG